MFQEVKINFLFKFSNSFLNRNVSKPSRTKSYSIRCASFRVLRVWLYLKVYILLINNFILKEKEISKSNSKFCKNKSENWLSKILVCPQYALDGNYIG